MGKALFMLGECSHEGVILGDGDLERSRAKQVVNDHKKNDLWEKQVRKSLA